MNKNLYFNIYKNLIRIDLLIFKQAFLNRFIDLTTWIVLNLFVVAQIMPSFGLVDSFGVFQLGGMLAAVGLFELYASTIGLITDLEGDRIIAYNLTLPIPSWFVIVSKASYYAIIYFFLTVAIFPVGKLLLWNQLDLSSINYIQLLLALIFQSIFYACFTIWAASVICNMSKLGSIWSRFVLPMWIMGGFQFSWKSLYGVTPIIALIDLINPIIYITESMRVAMLGQADYLNFWMCLGIIFLFSVFSFSVGLWNLKKRLDFVW